MSTGEAMLLARGVLLPVPVMRKHRDAGGMPGGAPAPLDGTPQPAAPAEADASAAIALLLADDPTDADFLRAPTRYAVPEGERRLMLALVRGALLDAQRPHVSTRRSDARAWLSDAAAPLSARACFEALGLNYDVVRQRLQRLWDAGGELKISRTVHRGSRTQVGR